jgi:hypothetical protein
MRITLAITFLAGLLGAACEGVLGNDDDNFVFDSIRVEYDSAMVANAEAIATLQNVQIDGLILLPHACHNLGGDYSRDGAQLTLTVIATPTNTTCTAAITAMQYRLITFGMPRGAYRVRVYHQFGTGQRTQIAEQDIVVG